MEQEWEFGKTNVKIEFRKYIFLVFGISIAEYAPYRIIKIYLPFFKITISKDINEDEDEDEEIEDLELITNNKED
jgi:hypothetical protein